ncbi:hypothetical protein [Xylella fastidiosa]
MSASICCTTATQAGRRIEGFDTGIPDPLVKQSVGLDVQRSSVATQP